MTDRDTSNGSYEHLLELLMQWREGTESERESARRQINDLMRDDEKNRATMAKLLVDETLIDQELRMQSVESLVDGSPSEASLLSEPVVTDQRQLGLNRLLYAVVAAVAASLVWLVFTLNQTSTTGQPAINVIAAEGVGTLDIERLQRGETTVLQRGILELELNAEARVVFEAPATFQVLSPRHVKLESGRCFAEMKKGTSGLRIETPSGNALDLGTVFAVEVHSPKEMEVHVFDGMVEVSSGVERKRLKEGEAASLEEEGKITPFPANPDLFVPRVPRGVVDESTFLHWSFDEGVGEIARATGSDPDVQRGEGRFLTDSDEPGELSWVTGISGNALKFEGDGWVKTDYPGISGNQDRTVACWVRLPVEEATEEVAPLVAWGLPGEKAGRRNAWMLSVVRDQETASGSDQLTLAVGRQSTFGTTNLRDGQWHHVAAVIVGGNHGTTILLYVDGELETMKRKKKSIETTTDDERSEPVQFGRHLYIRDLLLRGSLDEVYIFGAAFSGDEIRQLIHNHQPKK